MKKVMSLILVLTMMCSLVACKDSEKNQEELGQKETIESIESNKTIEETEPQSEVSKGETFVIPSSDEASESTLEVSTRNPVESAKQFVTAIATNQYDALLKLLNTNESSFFDEGDFKFAIPRSQYSVIADHAGKTAYVSVNSEDVSKDSEVARVKVNLCDENDVVLASFDVKLVIDKNNNWVVEDSDFYCENFYINVPGGSTLSINGSDVDKSYITGKSGHNDMNDVYTIPAIGKSEKVLKAYCDNFETEVREIPSSNNSDKESHIRIRPILSEDEMKEALEAVKNIWNNLYTDYSNGATSADLLKYFSKRADSTYPSTVVDAFKKMEEGSSGYKNKDFKITTISKRTDGGAECFYYTSDVIALNFQYHMDYVWELMSLDKYVDSKSNIYLCKEDGEYKIFEISDMNLFSE